MEVERLAKETGETSEFCMLQNGRYTIMHMRPGNHPAEVLDLNIAHDVP